MQYHSLPPSLLQATPGLLFYHIMRQQQLKNSRQILCDVICTAWYSFYCERWVCSTSSHIINKKHDIAVVCKRQSPRTAVDAFFFFFSPVFSMKSGELKSVFFISLNSSPNLQFKTFTASVMQWRLNLLPIVPAEIQIFLFLTIFFSGGDDQEECQRCSRLLLSL